MVIVKATRQAQMTVSISNNRNKRIVMNVWLKIIPIVVLATNSVYTFGKSVSLYCVPEKIILLPLGVDEDMFNGSCAEFKALYENMYDCHGFNLTFDPQGEDALKEFGAKDVLPLVNKSSYEYHFKLDEKGEKTHDTKELKLDRRDLSFEYNDTMMWYFFSDTGDGIHVSSDGSCEILDAAPVETLI